MPSYNKVILLGNLTRDPELRVTPKGTATCQLGLAVNRQFKDESGATRDETTFVDVDAWGRQAETISKYCTKGKPLLIEGRLKLDSWEDKTSGQKRSKLKVVLENFQFVGSREGGAQSGGSGEEVDQTAVAPPSPRRPVRATPMKTCHSDLCSHVLPVFFTKESF